MNNVLEDRAPEFAGTRSFFHRNLKWILPAAFLLFGAVVFYANQLVIVLQPEGDLPAQSFAVSKGEEWHILFTHSVQRTPVEEFFTVRGADDLLMTHTIYQSLGVGLPYSPSEGTYKQLPDGRFLLTMNRPFKTVKLRTAVQAMHKIIHGATVYDLCKLYGHGTLVEVKAVPRYRAWLN